jgi:hypothetical protein
MPQVLFNIPLTRWVHGTIEKMINSGKSELQDWCDFWLETYFELGGKSYASGSKICPKYAAYGLWRLGRIEAANIPYKKKTINIINQEYGKNAAYAILAIGLLEEGLGDLNQINFWIQVRERYRSTMHEEPAGSEQGEVRVARILYEEGQIITNQG